MMDRRLIVMRHAKSSWSDPAATDHERPLNARGRRDAPRVAARLAELQWLPDWVLSSDSRRTQETLSHMLAELPPELPVFYTPVLYHAGIEAVQQEVTAVPDDVQTLMLLGHNPGWEEMASLLSGEDVILKTANAALLIGKAENWQQAFRHTGTWKLWQVLRSREL